MTADVLNSEVIFMDLKQLRDGIDAIDSDILSLFMKRMELCRGINRRRNCKTYTKPCGDFD